MRISRGVFVRPKINRFVGKILPEPFQVAKAIAEKSNATIQIHGAEAVRRLGLSTQMPIQPVFYTSGPSKQVQLGKITIQLKHTTSRKLTLANRPAGLAITALWYLGKNAVTVNTVEEIKKKLPPEEFAALKAAIPSMPTWMANTMHSYKTKHRHA